MRAKSNPSTPWTLYVAYEGLPSLPIGCFPSFVDAARAMAEVASINAERLSAPVHVDVRLKGKEGPLARFEYEGKKQRYVIELAD